MGSNSSSIVRSEIAAKLQELAIIVQSAGEPAVADSLRKISGSEELIASFRKALLSGIHDKRYSKAEAQAKQWFENWARNDGGDEPRLSDEQVERLALLTKNWTQKNGNDVPQMVYDWIKDAPSKFWGFLSFRTDTQLVEYCIEDVESIDVAKNLDPIRRRVLLLILHDIVQTEKQRLKNESQASQIRDGEGLPKSKIKYLTMAIESIVERTYSHQKLANDEMKKKRERCTQLARYGKRWSLFLRRESILQMEIPNASENFERANIKVAEAEALNAYESIMYDEEYRTPLKTAFEAIYNAYMSQRGVVPNRHIHTGEFAATSSSLANLPSSQPSERFKQNPRAENISTRKRPRTSSTDNSHETVTGRSNRNRSFDASTTSRPAGQSLEHQPSVDVNETPTLLHRTASRSNGFERSTSPQETLFNLDTSLSSSFSADNLVDTTNSTNTTVCQTYTGQAPPHATLQNNNSATAENTVYQQFPNGTLPHMVPNLIDTDDAMQYTAYQPFLNGTLPHMVPNLIDTDDAMQYAAYQPFPNGTLPHMIPNLVDTDDAMQYTAYQPFPNGTLPHMDSSLIDTDDAMQYAAYQSYVGHNYLYGDSSQFIDTDTTTQTAPHTIHKHQDCRPFTVNNAADREAVHATAVSIHDEDSYHYPTDYGTQTVVRPTIVV